VFVNTADREGKTPPLYYAASRSHLSAEIVAGPFQRDPIGTDILLHNLLRNTHADHQENLLLVALIAVTLRARTAWLVHDKEMGQAAGQLAVPCQQCLKDCNLAFVSFATGCKRIARTDQLDCNDSHKASQVNFTSLKQSIRRYGSMDERFLVCCLLIIDACVAIESSGVVVNEAFNLGYCLLVVND